MSNRPLTERNADIVAARASGLSWASIAERYGVSRTRAQHIVYPERKRDVRRHRGTPEEAPPSATAAPPPVSTEPARTLAQRPDQEARLEPLDEVVERRHAEVEP